MAAADGFACSVVCKQHRFGGALSFIERVSRTPTTLRRFGVACSTRRRGRARNGG
jgi:hypothetical protein